MGAIDEFTARVYGRLGQKGTASPWARTSAAGKKQLAQHLEATYGVGVAKVTELDSVFRVDLADGSRWVARVNPAVRPLEVSRVTPRSFGFSNSTTIRPSASPTTNPCRSSVTVLSS